MRVTAWIYVVVLPVIAVSASLSNEYNHSVFMDPEEKYQLHWSIVGDKIHFAVQVNTTGWVGLGIATGLAGKMEGADMVIGYVVNGMAYAKDRHAVGQSRPLPDQQQDIELESGEERDGQTILKMNRKLLTCDHEDNNLKRGTAKLLYAYNDNDPTPGEDATINYHTKRGSRSMNLLEFIQNDQSPPGTPYLDALQEQLAVPSSSTTYWCRVVKLPDLGGKRHITEIRPVIQPGHESLVHHIILYGCKADLGDEHLDVSSHCYGGNMPPPVQSCAGASAVFSWAIGSKAFRFPKHVGLPIGMQGSSSYFVMETHYDNPQQQTGIVDSSGLRFYYTDQLRQYDAGLVQVGAEVTEAQLIPPGQKAWDTIAYCPSECSQHIASPTALNGNAIKIFAALPHAHLAGRAINASLVRNGKEISKLVQDDSYDFNFQQMLLLKDEVEMQAGDSVITTCRYNTENKNFATWGGLGTTEEMCLVFMMYYPLQNFTGCKTDSLIYYTTFSPKYRPPSGWGAVQWNQTMIDEWKSADDSPLQHSFCSGTEGRHHRDAYLTAVGTPVIAESLPEPQSPCSGYGAKSTIPSALIVVLAVVVFNVVAIV